MTRHVLHALRAAGHTGKRGGGRCERCSEPPSAATARYESGSHQHRARQKEAITQAHDWPEFRGVGEAKRALEPLEPRTVDHSLQGLPLHARRHSVTRVTPASKPAGPSAAIAAEVTARRDNRATAKTRTDNLNFGRARRRWTITLRNADWLGDWKQAAMGETGM